METNWTIDRAAITKNLTLSSALGAAYIVSTFLPLTAFVGGAAFITLGIVVVPVIAAVLRPVFATLAISVGSLGMALFGTGVYPVFGLFGLLIPIGAVVLGSIAFHHRWGPVIPWVYVLVGLLYYVVFSKGTMIWLLPYAVVIMSLPLAIWSKRSGVMLLLALYTAMTEQVTMNVLSISVIGLVGDIWTVITPFMFLERTVATVGGFAVIVGLKRRFGARLELGQLVQGR